MSKISEEKFPRKMILQNKMISLPTYPNFFGPVTGTTGIFSFGLTVNEKICQKLENNGIQDGGAAI